MNSHACSKKGRYVLVAFALSMVAVECFSLPATAVGTRRTFCPNTKTSLLPAAGTLAAATADTDAGVTGGVRRRRRGGEKDDSRRPTKRKREREGRDPAATAVLRWRLFNVDLPIDMDPGKDDCGVSLELMAVIRAKLGMLNEEGEDALDETDVVVVRKSFDARTRKDAEPRFCYTVDVRLDRSLARRLRLKPKQGKLEPSPPQGGPGLSASHPPGSYASSGANVSKRTLPSRLPTVSESGFKTVDGGSRGGGSGTALPGAKPSVAVVGAGPAGLFAALELVEAGIKPVIVERGMPVERRGREIGALFARRILNPESNLCYGEGGAGTWSDGKLTTRIGKNGGGVRKVLETLVAHGAPERILVDGKPHLGTDRLVRILREVRSSLMERGASFRFDTKVVDLLTRGGGQRGAVRGLKLADGGEILADRVVLAVGHSARPVYERLLEAGVGLRAKGIAVGLRVEHPQAMIDDMMYGAEVAALVNRGKGKVPVADYRLTQTLDSLAEEEPEGQGRRQQQGQGHERAKERGCYSFCMCPGGQVVPTSVDPREVCVNGMSFSKRDSRWANAALVVSLSPQDIADDVSAIEGEGSGAGDSPLRGVRWQSAMERRAAEMGGGNLGEDVGCVYSEAASE